MASTSRRLSLRFAVALLLLLLAGISIVIFRGLGNWLTREDPLKPADVLVVLSGGMPSRADEAARLYRMGYAPEVWVSRPPSAAAELAARGITYLGEEAYNREVLIHGGVPPERIFVFPEMVSDTEEEIEEIARRLRAERRHSAIIVTSPEHTRRVRVLWRRLAGDDLNAVVRAAPEDPFDAAHWWRNTRDTFAVTRELMGLANAWSGLPVRPRAQ
jgi:uncharacterized SAM-binding protein YcdF (DUF218 family)